MITASGIGIFTVNRIIILLLSSLLFCQSAAAGIYKWVDENGKVHFSDKKPETSDNPDYKRSPVSIKKFQQKKKASLPHRFVMTDNIVNARPVNNLSTIDINEQQSFFFTYIKLMGIVSGNSYELRVQIVDAADNPVFDMKKKLTGGNSFLWFAAKVHPTIGVDAPGKWTIEGTINGKHLFTETRQVVFAKKLSSNTAIECRNAISENDVAVCNDGALARLDKEMSLQYSRLKKNYLPISIES